MTFEQIMELWAMVLITIFVACMVIGIFDIIKSGKR